MTSDGRGTTGDEELGVAAEQIEERMGDGELVDDDAGHDHVEDRDRSTGGDIGTAGVAAATGAETSVIGAVGSGC